MNAEEYNCMTFIVGKAASATGRVLLGHNEDDSGNITVRRTVIPAKDWAPGTLIPAEPGLAVLPQVPHTLSCYWVEFLNPETGLSSADIFYNECGVAITSNSMGRSRENDDDPSVVKDGGLGYNLRRILAERARSARDGARILTELMDEWGYAPSGRAYTIADREEAFMFQLVRGHHYIGGRVPDDGIVVMPNEYDFHTLRDVPEMFYPRDIVTYAIEKGWYLPRTEDFSDFDFAKAYQDGSRPNFRPNNFYRQMHGRRIVLGRDWNMETEGTPFSVRAERQVDFRILWQALTTHYEGTADGEANDGPTASPHTSGYRKICCATTLECDLFDFAENPADTCIYTALGRPCQVPVLPLHPFRGLPEGIGCKEDPFAMMAAHLLPRRGEKREEEQTAARFRDFGETCELQHRELAPLLRPVPEELLGEALAENRQVSASPEEAATVDAAYAGAVLKKLETFANKHFSA